MQVRQQQIRLDVEFAADPLLMDDREGVIAARREGLAVTGTLGALDPAAERRLLSLGEAAETSVLANGD